MRLISTFKIMFVVFCAATTFQVLFISIFAWIGDNPYSYIYSRNLYQHVALSALCTLPSLLFIGMDDNISRTKGFILRLAHFILTAGIIFLFVIHFNWLYTGNASVVAIIFIILYFSISAVLWMRAKKLEKQLNERLDAFHRGKNASQD